MKILNKIKNARAKLPHFLLFILIVIYLLLAFKNPFSVRSLVPNLEPYPDTLYYSNPPWNLIHNKGFVMQAFDYRSKIITPPLYSIYLIPFFALFQDVRSFYFANLLLIIGSLALFVQIAYKLLYRRLFDMLIIAFIGLLFVTNFYLYTLPSLLMAENITLFFSMAGLYLLIFSSSVRKSAIAGMFGVGMTMIKFSNAPLSGVFYILYGFKVLRNKSKEKIRLVFGLSAFLSITFFVIYIVGSQILLGHKNLSPGIGFSHVYFLQNIQQYLKILTGENDRLLWFNNRMVSPALALPIIFGIVAGLFGPQRKVTLQMLIYGLSTVIFMSFFYTRDIRYILMVTPIILLFVGFTFLFLKEHFHPWLTIAFMTLLGAAYLLLPQLGHITDERIIITLKKQVGLNFRHAEEPWNYKAVVEFNSYFSKYKNKKPYMGTLLPPYFVSYYSNGNYNYLPVSMGQEFFGDKKNAPKIFFISLVDYYTNLLKKGNEIYISPYYQSNLVSWKKDYDDLSRHFNLKLVKSGCYNTCNIFRLKDYPLDNN